MLNFYELSDILTCPADFWVCDPQEDTRAKQKTLSLFVSFLDVYSGIPEGGRGRSSPNSSGYSKPRRSNKPTQNYYVPPRQQKYKDKG